MTEEKQPTEGSYKREGNHAYIFMQGNWVQLNEVQPVELTPKTGTILYHAWYAEQSRIRHEKEFWLSQAERDIFNRGLWRQKAIDAGVPAAQADRYIYSGPWDGE